LDNVSSDENSNENSINYCSKCLSVLGDDMVKDVEGNEFCDCECRHEYWREIRLDMDDLVSEFR